MQYGIFSMRRDAARRAGLSAPAELLVLFVSLDFHKQTPDSYLLNKSGKQISTSMFQ